MADGKNYGSFGPLIQNIKWAAANGGRNPAAAGMAAMLGIPMYHRYPGGDWMTIDPRRQAIYPMGMTPPQKQAAVQTGGEDPAYDPNDPNSPLPGDKYKKNQIPEWWRQWYRTQGQYGGVPPVDGLL